MIESICNELKILRGSHTNLELVLEKISRLLIEFETISVMNIHRYAFDVDNTNAQETLETIYQFFELLLLRGDDSMASLNLLGGVIQNQELQAFHQSINDASNSVLTIHNWDDIMFKIILKILSKEKSVNSILTEREHSNLKECVIKQVLYMFRKRLSIFGLDSNFVVRIMSDDRYKEYKGFLIPLLVGL